MPTYARSLTHTNRGWSTHTVEETDSDGDGGPAPKLRGRGHIEFSQKGIPHGSLHFPEQVKWAGHLFMHDTCAPEAAHKTNIKVPMDRVRKGNDQETSGSMIAWVFRTTTWGKIIANVEREYAGLQRKKRTTKKPTNLLVKVHRSKIHRPTPDVSHLFRDNTFSPLSAGGDNLLTPDVRVSYYELATLISKAMCWPIGHVQNDLKVRLYCSAQLLFPSGATRTYWSTDSRYPYFGGSRRDMVQVDLGNGNIGAAQLVSFIEMEDLPIGVVDRRAQAVLLRWLTVPPHPQRVSRDPHNRPMCEYPLSSNHCLWQWSEAEEDRQSFQIRGFMNLVTTQRMWAHVPAQHRRRAIDSEIRAHYNVLQYANIIDHANIALDPTTGHMLHTLQMI